MQGSSSALGTRTNAGTQQAGEGRVVIAAFGVELIQARSRRYGSACSSWNHVRRAQRARREERSSVRIKARCRSFSIQVKQTQVTREYHHARRLSTLGPIAALPFHRGRWDGSAARNLFAARHECWPRGIQRVRENTGGQEPRGVRNEVGVGGSS